MVLIDLGLHLTEACAFHKLPIDLCFKSVCKDKAAS